MTKQVNCIVDSVAFEGPKSPYKGFTVRGLYLKEPTGDALIEILKEGKVHKRFLFPAYKVWNIPAHFQDIIDGELEGSTAGYELAAWDGISGSVITIPVEEI